MKNSDEPTAYLAGPMRGIPNANHPAFDDAKKRLTYLGWRVISPADLDRSAGIHPGEDGQISNSELRDAMARDLPLLCGSDAIYLLPGWRQSEGAFAEYNLASALQVRVMHNEETDGALAP